MSDEYKQFTRELTARLDIVDIISNRINIKKAGKEYHACCPFHNEKTPSFTISPQKQFFYCFGCHAKGDAISFVMQHDKLTFPEAVEKLAQTVGLTPPKTNQGPIIDRALYKTMRAYTLLAKQDLQNDKTIISYLQERKIKPSILQHYHIGYSGPKSGQYIQNQLKSDQDASTLRACGLLSEREHKVQAKFFKRILFPIQDTQGRIIALGGRVTEPDRQPKYLNSPETILFKKRQTLYGLYQLSKLQLDQVFVVEGYMDVLALASCDIPQSVACLGTAFTEQHWRLITRYSDKVVFCFDGDKAGKRAAWLTLTNILPILKPEKSALFMFMPEGDDPDSYCQNNGKSAFLQLADHAISWDTFFVKQLKTSHDTTTVSGQAAFTDQAMDLIKTMQHKTLAQTLQEAVLPKSVVNEASTPTPVVKKDNNFLNKYQSCLHTIFSQLLSKNETPWHDDEEISNLSHHQSLHALNSLLQHLRGKPEADSHALRAVLEQQKVLDLIYEKLDPVSCVFSAHVLTVALHQLRILLLEKEIRSYLSQQEKSDITAHQRKIMHTLILQKKQLENDYISLLNHIPDTS